MNCVFVVVLDVLLPRRITPVAALTVLLRRSSNNSQVEAYLIGEIVRPTCVQRSDVWRCELA